MNQTEGAGHRPYFIGIAGSSGAGKTTVLRAIDSVFEPREISVILQDNYYLPREMQQADQNGVTNFDRPESIDREAFYRDIEGLLMGRPAERKEYTYNNADKEARVIRVEPAPILIAEGLFVFDFEEINRLLDYRVFILADDEVALARRIKRDTVERGYPESDVRYRWEHHVRPAYEKHLLPHLPECDLVIHNNDHYREDLDILLAHIKQILNEKAQ